MTVTTGSSRLKPSQIRCAIRGEWVATTPEENVRQKLLGLMISELGFPKAWICVEQPLRDLPHLASVKTSVPARRADIICYAQGINHPLILIECKAVALTAKTERQLIGYNHYVRAPFVCLANQETILTGWKDKGQGGYRFIPGLPPCIELLNQIRNLLQ